MELQTGQTCTFYWVNEWAGFKQSRYLQCFKSTEKPRQVRSMSYVRAGSWGKLDLRRKLWGVVAVRGCKRSHEKSHPRNHCRSPERSSQGSCNKTQESTRIVEVWGYAAIPLPGRLPCWRWETCQASSWSCPHLGACPHIGDTCGYYKVNKCGGSCPSQRKTKLSPNSLFAHLLCTPGDHLQED